MILFPCVNTQIFIEGLLTSYTVVDIFKAIYPHRKHNFEKFSKIFLRYLKLKLCDIMTIKWLEV